MVSMEDNEHSIEFNQSSFDNKEFDNKLRPISFSEFSGQQEILKNLKVFVEAANQRNGIPSPAQSYMLADVAQG